MPELSLLAILGAGVLSFLSPCVLPLVAPYLTYMSGSSFEQLRDPQLRTRQLYSRTIVTSLFFVLGFSLVFVTLGATATLFGQAFRQLLPFLTPLAGIAVIGMGLHFLGIYRIALLDQQVRSNGPGVATGPMGGFLLGLAFAIGWTPCIGPVLATILSLASSKESAIEGAGLLAVYSAGLGIPFLLAGIAVGPFLAFSSSFKRHLGIVEKVTGGLLVVTGLLMVSGKFSLIAFWLLETFPMLAQLG